MPPLTTNPLLTSTNRSYVKNPQYTPGDPSSNRYVDSSRLTLNLNPIDQKMEKMAGKSSITNLLQGSLNRSMTSAGFTTPSPAWQQIGQNLSIGIGGRLEPKPVPAGTPTTPARANYTAPIQATPNYGTTTPAPATGMPTAGGQPVDPSKLSDTELRDLATKAGAAGMSLEDYISVVNTNSTVTRAQSDQNRTDLGVDEARKRVFSKPEESLNEVYRNLYKERGLEDVKKRISDVDTRINQKRDDFNKVEGEIRNNPWLSSASRRGRLATAADLALNDIGNDLTERQQLLDEYDSNVTDIERQLANIISDRNLNREIDTEELNFLLNEAERLDTLQTGENLTAGLRNIPAFLDARVQEQRRQEQRELDLIYARSVGSGGGATGVPGGSSVLVNQPAYSQLSTTQQKQADSLNNLVRSMDELATYYEQNPGILGGQFGNMFGEDSAVLQSKINGIIFAAAQAEGTGALQEADRGVIEQMIPNPTNLGGALNTAFRGGKAGNLAKIREQVAKYTENLRQFGLEPVSTGSSAGTPQSKSAAASYVTSLGIK